MQMLMHALGVVVAALQLYCVAKGLVQKGNTLGLVQPLSPLADY